MSQGGVGERRDSANPIGGRLPAPSRIEGDVSVLVLGIGLLDRVSSFVILRLGNRAIGIGSLGIAPQGIVNVPEPPVPSFETETPVELSNPTPSAKLSSYRYCVVRPSESETPPVTIFVFEEMVNNKTTDFAAHSIRWIRYDADIAWEQNTNLR